MISRPIFVGIDPGETGGIAIVRPEGAVTFLKYKTPCGDFFNRYKLTHTNCIVALEKVGASPQMGTSSAFTFGKNAGHWEEAILDRGFECFHLLPQEWQSHFGKFNKDYSKKKEELFVVAKKEFPDLKFPKYIADALLLAKFLKDRYGIKTTGSRKLSQ